jgi:hypothetical protein
MLGLQALDLLVPFVMLAASGARERDDGQNPRSGLMSYEASMEQEST